MIFYGIEIKKKCFVLYDSLKNSMKITNDWIVFD
jgi:hypothetical protein